MRKKLLTLAGMALLLTGCAASPADTAEKCGGEDAGISVTSESVIEYDQDFDTTGDAWKCLLTELVPEKTDQYTITQGLGEPGTTGDIRVGGRPIVWGTSPQGAIRLYFNP